MTKPCGSRRLWFVAGLPPPIDGQKACNAAMLERLAPDFSPVLLPLGRSAAGKIRRALLNALMLLLKGGRGQLAYVSIPGQLGAWLLLPSVLALRLRGIAVWFHHHSFRPINRGPLTAMRALVACAGGRQRHILLSDGMRDRFAALYLPGRAVHALAVSNTFLLAPDIADPPPPRPKRAPTLGHMSVLTREKGVFYLLELFDELRRSVPDIRLVVAGPTRDPNLAKALRDAAARHPDGFEYRGAVGGDEKARFYRDVDLFILPTTLVDEAEPLVMIEAYSRGVDVFATPTGCIPDRIRTPDFYLMLDRMTDAAAIIKALCRQPDGWARRRRACHAHVERLAIVGRRQGELLTAQLRAMTDGDRQTGQTHPSAI